MEYNPSTKGFFVFAMDTLDQYILFESDSNCQYLRTINEMDVIQRVLQGLMT